MRVVSSEEGFNGLSQLILGFEASSIECLALQQSSFHEWRRFGVCGGSHHVDSQALAITLRIQDGSDLIQDLRVADRGDVETEKLRTRQSHATCPLDLPLSRLALRTS
jgi:hypothetical protein